MPAAAKNAAVACLLPNQPNCTPVGVGHKDNTVRFYK